MVYCYGKIDRQAHTHTLEHTTLFLARILFILTHTLTHLHSLSLSLSLSLTYLVLVLAREIAHDEEHDVHGFRVVGLLIPEPHDLVDVLREPRLPHRLGRPPHSLEPGDAPHPARVQGHHRLRVAQHLDPHAPRTRDDAQNAGQLRVPHLRLQGDDQGTRGGGCVDDLAAGWERLEHFPEVLGDGGVPAARVGGALSLCCGENVGLWGEEWGEERR